MARMVRLDAVSGQGCPETSRTETPYSETSLSGKVELLMAEVLHPAKMKEITKAMRRKYFIGKTSSSPKGVFFITNYTSLLMYPDTLGPVEKAKMTILL